MRLPSILPATPNRFRTLLYIALLCCTPLQVMALGFVTATANVSSFIVEHPQPLTIRWLIGTGGSKGKVMSTQGSFESIDGLVLGVIIRGISGTATGTPNVTLTEGLAIPATVIARATSMGLRSIVYRRSFRDSSGGGSVDGQLIFNLIYLR